ncbi:MAG: response regulator transcription factor [Sedimentisphaerales bacterium]|nr:response regulator transcription factor [Sedimentisphaerales bacterium]
MPIRVLIVDDYELLRRAIALCIAKEPDIEVAGEAEDGRVAVRLALDLNPDVVVMDVAMPNLNGVEATRQIVHERSDMKVIAFSPAADRRSVQEMLEAGASGYVPKSCSVDELITAIRSVASHRVYLSPQICRMVVDGYINRSRDNRCAAGTELTAREREVLQLIAEGQSTKTMAKVLCLSTKTVEWHRSRIMKKLGIESIAGLVRYAMAEGLTSVELTASGLP